MREHKYILVGKKAVPCSDLKKWAMNYERRDKDRIVKQQKINGYWISTVFLALDQSFRDDGPPILFETKVFTDDEADEFNHHTEQCSTWKEAERQHRSVVARVRLNKIVFNIDKHKSEIVIDRAGVITIDKNRAFVSRLKRKR